MTQENMPSLMQDRGDPSCFLIKKLLLPRSVLHKTKLYTSNFIWNYEDGSVIQFAIND
jgi:hypothetical protein